MNAQRFASVLFLGLGGVFGYLSFLSMFFNRGIYVWGSFLFITLLFLSLSRGLGKGL